MIALSLFDDDIVRDILRRVVRAAQDSGGFDDALAAQIERQVRADWGGVETYIAVRADSATARAEKIQQLWDSGERDVRMLASRFGITTRRVRQIVGR